MKFNLNDYTGKYAMHCRTLKEAEDFCRFLDKNGKKWCSGHSYLQFISWNDLKDDTAYYFTENTYGSSHTARKNDYTVLEWSDFMENSEDKFSTDESQFQLIDNEYILPTKKVDPEIPPEDITGVLGQLLDEVELPDELHKQVHDLYKRATELL